MSPRVRPIPVLAGLLAALLASAALGYEIRVCDGPLQDPDKIQWLTTPLLRASDDFPVGVRHTALEAAVAGWNASPADFVFELDSGDRNVGLDNGQNEVWISNDADLLDGAPAITFWIDDCGAPFAGNNELVEADVVFACDDDDPGCADATGRQWTWGTAAASMSAYGGGERPFRATATHELGHALGLQHVDTEYNVMGIDFSHLHAYGTSATAYPGEDAADGAVNLYGVDASKGEDLAVAHWRYLDATADGYSRHARTRILDPELEVEVGTVDAGQEIRVELSLENLGVSNHAAVDETNNFTFSQRRFRVR